MDVMLGSKRIEEYIEMYRSLEEIKPDSHVILYSYNLIKNDKVSLVDIKQLLGMFKYIEKQSDKSEYNREYKRLIFYLNKVLGVEIMRKLKRGC